MEAKMLEIKSNQAVLFEISLKMLEQKFLKQ